MMLTKLLTTVTLCALVLTGCDSGPIDEEKSSQTLAFNDAGPVSMFVGESIENPATGQGTGSITYASSDTAVATVSNVGTVSALSAGQAIITASIAADDTFNGRTELFILYVSAPGTTSQTLTFATPTSVTGTVDDVIANAATGQGTGAVTYASSDTAVATVDTAGSITLLTGGTSTITASIAADTQWAAQSNTYELTSNKKVQTLTFATPTSVTGTVDDVIANAATGQGTGAVTYASSDTAVATVDTAGSITLLTGGTSTITASIAADTQWAAQSNTYELTSNKKVQTLTFATPTSLTGTIDDIFANPATGQGSGTVTYSSSNDAVATVDIYGGILMLSAGNATITATIAADTQWAAQSNTYELTSNKKVQTLALADTGPIALFVGNSLNNVALGEGTGTVSYASSDDNIASVSNTGKVTAVSAGQATITATIATDTIFLPQSDTYIVNVSAAGTTSQTLSFATPTSLTGTIDDIFANPATGQGSGTVTYSSSNDAVATVDIYGGILMLSAGNATITATIAADAVYALATNSFDVSVTKKVATYAFNDGGPVSILLTNSYTNAITGTGGTITFTSSDPSIASVDPVTGQVTATTLTGDAVITATMVEDSQWQAASWNYDVHTRYFEEMLFEYETWEVPPSVNATIGCAAGACPATYFKRAFLRNEGGHSPQITYVSSDTTIASVDSVSGVVTMLKEGLVTITASALEDSEYIAATGSYQLTLTKSMMIYSFIDSLGNPLDPLFDGNATLEGTVDDVVTITVMSEGGAPDLWTSSNTAVATVSNGTVTMLTGGTATISASNAGDTYWKAASNSFELTVNKFDQTITEYRPEADGNSFNLMLSDGLQLIDPATKDSSATIVYSSTDSSVAYIADVTPNAPEEGRLFAAKLGNALVTITIPADDRFNAWTRNYGVSVIAQVAPAYTNTGTVYAILGTDFENPLLVSDANLPSTPTMTTAGIITINADGTFTPIGTGVTTITATLEKETRTGTYTAYSSFDVNVVGHTAYIAAQRDPRLASTTVTTPASIDGVSAYFTQEQGCDAIANSPACSGHSGPLTTSDSADLLYAGINTLPSYLTLKHGDYRTRETEIAIGYMGTSGSLASGIFTARHSPQVTELNGEFYLIGGENIGGLKDFNNPSYARNDVWKSTDGTHWTLLTANAPFTTRYQHQVVAFQNKLWVIGGWNELDTANNHLPIWSSVDGINWVNENASPAFSSRAGHTVTEFDSKLWLINGMNEVEDAQNDIWSSSDGVNWTLEATNPFPARYEHQVTNFNGALWLIGGSDINGDMLSDIWSSADGVNWTLVNDQPAFGPKSNHELIQFDNRLWVLGGVANSWNDVQNDVWSSSDGYSWTQENRFQPTFSKRSDFGTLVVNGKLWAIGGFNGQGCCANVLGDIWSTTDGARWVDETPVLRFSPRSNHQVTEFKGKLWTIGGLTASGIYSNEVWSSLDGIDWRQVATKGSADGLLTNNNMFVGRSEHQVLVHDDKLWVIGGRNGDSALNNLNDVWSSVDGAVWIRTSPEKYVTGSGWVPSALNNQLGKIRNHQIVPYVYASSAAKELVILGGTDDVSDALGEYRLGGTAGEIWEPALPMPRREGHQATLLNRSGQTPIIVVTGGKNNTGFSFIKTTRIAYDDPTGWNWSEPSLGDANDIAVNGRTEHQATAFVNSTGNPTLYLSGGIDSAGTSSGNLWESNDGLTWTPVLLAAPWGARSEHQMVVFNNRLWVIGGKAADGTVLNDIWASDNYGRSWQEQVSFNVTFASEP